VGMIGLDFETLATELSAKCSDRRSVTGLMESELRELERGLGGRKLPLVYREFMSRMGRDAGPLLAGTDAFYPEIVEYQEDAWDLVSEGSVEHLVSAGCIIFAIHQGYQIYYMSLDVGDDPPVFMYQEGDSGMSSSWKSFSLFILDELSSIS
jgi:hypothetical protein